MLRVDKETDGCVTRLLLSGRIQSDAIDCIRSVMNGVFARKILNLGEVTLVDTAGVKFLLSCEDEGIELAECPPYVREWMLRERAEASEPEPSKAA